MAEPRAPRLSKWPFWVGDLLLVGTAAWIVFHAPNLFTAWPLLGLVGSVALGAWLAVTPFLVEYRARLRFAEADHLATTVGQIEHLSQVAKQINAATAQWQANQDQAARTAAVAKEIAERISVEAKTFSEALLKANDAEKNQLRLEVEKLHRAEGDWLQALVRILDNVFLLHQAGVKSNQPTLREQLGTFQHVCRELARRVGLVAFEPKPGETFNPQVHRLHDAESTPPAGSIVEELIAPGFTFQGRLLRAAMVRVSGETAEAQGHEAEVFEDVEPQGELPPEGLS